MEDRWVKRVYKHALVVLALGPVEVRDLVDEVLPDLDLESQHVQLVLGRAQLRGHHGLHLLRLYQVQRVQQAHLDAVDLHRLGHFREQAFELVVLLDDVRDGVCPQKRQVLEHVEREVLNHQSLRLPHLEHVQREAHELHLQEEPHQHLPVVVSAAVLGELLEDEQDVDEGERARGLRVALAGAEQVHEQVLVRVEVLFRSDLHGEAVQQVDVRGADVQRLFDQRLQHGELVRAGGRLFEGQRVVRLFERHQAARPGLGLQLVVSQRRQAVYQVLQRARGGLELGPGDHLQLLQRAGRLALRVDF